MNAGQWIQSVSKFDIVADTVEFNSAATLDEVIAFEDHLSFKTPETLRILWQQANGEASGSEGIFGGFRFLPIGESREAIENNLSIIADDEGLQDLLFDSFLGKTKLFESDWIPFAGLFNRNLLIIAERSDEQIVFEWSLEGGPERLLSRSFVEFLGEVQDQLISDNEILDLDDLEPKSLK